MVSALVEALVLAVPLGKDEADGLLLGDGREEDVGLEEQRGDVEILDGGEGVLVELLRW